MFGVEKVKSFVKLPVSLLLREIFSKLESQIQIRSFGEQKIDLNGFCGGILRLEPVNDLNLMDSYFLETTNLVAYKYNLFDHSK